MSQSYTKSCMFCKHEIVMSDKGAGKWLPYDLNGTVHECKKETTSTSTGTKKVETNKQPDVTPEAKAWVREIMEGPKIKELDDRLKRVEKILFQEGNKK